MSALEKTLTVFVLVCLTCAAPASDGDCVASLYFLHPDLREVELPALRTT